jgi:hypothetical protein
LILKPYFKELQVYNTLLDNPDVLLPSEIDHAYDYIIEEYIRHIDDLNNSLPNIPEQP